MGEEIPNARNFKWHRHSLWRRCDTGLLLFSGSFVPSRHAGAHTFGTTSSTCAHCIFRTLQRSTEIWMLPLTDLVQARGYGSAWNMPWKWIHVIKPSRTWVRQTCAWLAEGKQATVLTRAMLFSYSINTKQRENNRKNSCICYLKTAAWRGFLVFSNKTKTFLRQGKPSRLWNMANKKSQLWVPAW